MGGSTRTARPGMTGPAAVPAHPRAPEPAAERKLAEEDGVFTGIVEELGEVVALRASGTPPG